MTIDQRALVDLTEEVDQMHHEGMSTIREQAEELCFGEHADRFRDSRRSMLAKMGAGGALLTLGALAGPVTPFLSPASAATMDDADIAIFAASVEFALVAIYQSISDSHKLSATTAKTARIFQGHHREHGRAFNTATGATIEKPNAKVVAAYSAKVRAAADQNALLEIAYTLEEAAAASYLFTLGVLQDTTNAGLVASILPVESQHAVVLGRLLKKAVGEYMPSFQTDKQALDPTQYPV